MSQRMSPLPPGSEARKMLPLASGFFDYFEAAIAEVARVSWVGNEKHNAGEEVHWAREKSSDEADALLRHFVERGRIEEVQLPDGRIYALRSSAMLAWRALAILQKELEAAGLAPLARGARLQGATPEEVLEARLRGDGRG